MSTPTVHTIPFFGGHVALDLLNTVERLETAAPIELLRTWADLLAWAQRAGVVTAAEARALATTRAPGEPARVRELRDTLRAALLGEPAGLEPLRAAWLDALAAADLRAGDGLAAGWPTGPAAVRHRLAAAAFGLLCDPAAVARVRRCDGHGCGGMFLDASRNRSRRYCSTDGCGNRERVRRHRARRS